MDLHILGKKFQGKLTPLSHGLYPYPLGMLISDSEFFFFVSVLNTGPSVRQVLYHEATFSALYFNSETKSH